MRAEPFAYSAPRTVEEAVELLAAGGDVAILGGGTMLVPELTSGRRCPDHILDLRHLDLAAIACAEGILHVGAAVTYQQVLASPSVRSGCALLRIVAEGVTGGAQIRNQGTLGGSACYANPASDIPACLVALEARLHLRGPQGLRDVAASDFFREGFRTLREPDELLVEITTPTRRDGEMSGYVKLKICEGSWPIATAACRLLPGRDGEGLTARIALGGVAAAPVLVCAPTSLAQLAADPGEVERIAQIAQDSIVSGWSDELATSDYRRAVAAPVVRRALQAALRTRSAEES